ncbi:hypothetical protein ES705_43920 [subsurface metagenome]
MDKVAKVHSELYQRAVELAKTDGISMADAINKLVEAGGAGVPTGCQLGHFANILAEQGLTPPRRPEWVWGVTDVLPAEMLAGTKLEPYAKARTEAELRCALGDELYGKLITGELDSEEQAAVEILTEDIKTPPVTEPEPEPVTEPEPEPVTE